MSRSWTVQQILDLAPDASSQKAGKGLSPPGKWSLLGCDERSLWGEIKGSGKKPYQARIDLTEPAFKCSCPSRKFPCKHGLGLFLAYVDSPKSFKASEAPDWVTDWLTTRGDRAAKKVERAEKKKESAGDPAAQAKRAAAREKKITAGLEELQTWLADLLRRGFAGVSPEGYEFWDKMAARMVDSQAPGLARLVRDLGGMALSGEGWEARMLSAIGRLHLISEGYGRLEQLEPDLRDSLRTAVGWTENQDAVLQRSGVADTWLVVAQQLDQEDRLTVQRIWLWGQKQNQPALILNFAAGSQQLDSSLAVGTQFMGELVYFPGAQPLRALVKARQGDVQAIGPLPGEASLTAALSAYSRALSRVPWMEVWPLSLSGMRLSFSHTSQGTLWHLCDREDHMLPLNRRFEQGWELLTLSGGQPISLFGLWSGEDFQPLSASCDGRFFTMGRAGNFNGLLRVA